MKKLFRRIYNLRMKAKIYFYRRYLSTIKPTGNFIIAQPCLFEGKGKIEIGEDVLLGYFPSAQFYSTYSHIEARFDSAKIKIGDRTAINNNCNIVAEANTVEVGSDCLIGANFCCFDSDFHSLDPNKRGDFNSIKRANVKIGNNVFIGYNVTILKGSNIGNNCTIGANSIVSGNFSDNSIIAGNPAKVIKQIEN